MAASGTPSQTSSWRERWKPVTTALCSRDYITCYHRTCIRARCSDACRRAGRFTRAARDADSALPAGRSAGLGADRPPALAEGVQRRVQVRRQARRSRRSDAGHLPQDLQVARHVRSPREFPDVADQRQPQSVHRSLPQRAQGARDDRPRRRRQRAVAGVAGSRARSRRSNSAIASCCCGRRWRRCPRRCGPRWCCATSRSCRTRKSPTAEAAGRHREVAHQPWSHRARAAVQKLRGADFRRGRIGDVRTRGANR